MVKRRSIFTQITDEIILQTNEEENSNHAWNTDLNSSLWLWGGRLGHNLQFRPDYFSNFFNKVLLNTIQGHQVFCFVPMVQYHPRTVAATKDIEGVSDTIYNVNTNNANINLGYFPIRTGTFNVLICFR